jgi:hypothetical protein
MEKFFLPFCIGHRAGCRFWEMSIPLFILESPERAPEAAARGRGASHFQVWRPVGHQ